MLGVIKGIIKFVWNDLRTDYLFLKQVYNGTYKLKHKVTKADIKKAMISILKDKWTYVLIMFLIAFYLSGWMGASAHYQQACNQYIYENLMTAKVTNGGLAWPNNVLVNFTYNLN